MADARPNLQGGWLRAAQWPNARCQRMVPLPLRMLFLAECRQTVKEVRWFTSIAHLPTSPKRGMASLLPIRKSPFVGSAANSPLSPPGLRISLTTGTICLPAVVGPSAICRDGGTALALPPKAWEDRRLGGSFRTSETRAPLRSGANTPAGRYGYPETSHLLEETNE